MLAKSNTEKICCDLNTPKCDIFSSRVLFEAIFYVKLNPPNREHYACISYQMK